MSAAPDLWSRRKARVAAEAAAEAEAQTARAAETALAGRSDAEILAELDLPDPDTLVSGEDAVRFMARAVPEHLRRRALRRLWRTNPVLANLDGLVDYDADFTAPATGEVVQTAYRVGKGMLAHIEELARQAEAAEEIAAAPPEAEPAPEAEPEPPAADAAPEPDQPATEPEPDRIASAPRRMRFAFEG